MASARLWLRLRLRRQAGRVVTPRSRWWLGAGRVSVYLRAHRYVKSAVDVAQYNVSSMCHEIITGTKYDAPWEVVQSPLEAAEAAVDAEPPKVSELPDDAGGDGAAAAAPAPAPMTPAQRGKRASKEEGPITVPQPDFKVNFLPLRFVCPRGQRARCPAPATCAALPSR